MEGRGQEDLPHFDETQEPPSSVYPLLRSPSNEWSQGGRDVSWCQFGCDVHLVDPKAVVNVKRRKGGRGRRKEGESER